MVIMITAAVVVDFRWSDADISSLNILLLGCLLCNEVVIIIIRRNAAVTAIIVKPTEGVYSNRSATAVPTLKKTFEAGRNVIMVHKIPNKQKLISVIPCICIFRYSVDNKYFNNYNII